MKKLFLLVFTMLVAVLCFAQETKKVAILETVDREGKVSYGIKLILRSSLAKAITGTEGYEAYDRTDMDAILGEQNFQRTGMVSNEQIKRLGEMTGAKYVLVAEAAVVDANNMYVTAKLLDVETARTEMTDNQMMGITPKEIQRGCQLLANNLVKSGHSAVTETTAKSKGKVAKEKKQEKASASNKKSLSDLGYITKVSDNEYRIGRYKMTKKGYEKFIYDNCPEAWRKYNGGKKAIAAGWSLFSIGAVSIIAGGVLHQTTNYYSSLSDENYSKYKAIEYKYGYAKARESDAYNNYWYYYDISQTYYRWEISGYIIGGCLAGIGLITFSSGYGAKGNAYKTYNKKCAGDTPITLNLKSDQNGIGLALQF